MKKGQKLWTRAELLLAMNLYCKLPFGKMHSRTPEVVALAQLLDRTPGSIALKLVNLASLDPSLQARGIRGASNASKLDKEVWNEFYQNWDELPFESEQLLAKQSHTSLEKLLGLDENSLPKQGKEREQRIKARVNQQFFRQSIMAAYENRCCVTGLQQPQLLIASHIRPWGLDESNRLNPRNGLALNALHDKAFEQGLMTITADYTILISSSLRQHHDQAMRQFFAAYHQQPMQLPHRFVPDPDFLRYHHHERFIP